MPPLLNSSLKVLKPCVGLSPLGEKAGVFCCAARGTYHRLQSHGQPVHMRIKAHVQSIYDIMKELITRNLSPVVCDRQAGLRLKGKIEKPSGPRHTGNAHLILFSQSRGLAHIMQQEPDL